MAQDGAAILQQLHVTPHSLLPVCDGDIDNVIGIVRTRYLISELILRQRIDVSAAGPLRAPIVLPATAGVLKAMETLKRAHGQLVLATDAYGTVQGLLTPIDLLEAIAGEFPDEDQQLTVRSLGPGRWEVDGAADLHLLQQALETDTLVMEGSDYTSLAGFLLARFEMFPDVGDVIELDGLRFEVLAVQDRRIARVGITRVMAVTGRCSLLAPENKNGLHEMLM